MGIDYNTITVTDGLVAYWDVANTRSYSGSGLTLNGLIGGLGATLVNGVAYSGNNLGYLTFDGSNDYVNAANPSELQLTTGTICVWCRTSSPGSGYRGIVAKQYAYGIFYNSNNLTLYDWAVPRGNDTGVNLADGNWKHISFSFQSGVTNGSVLYLNSVGILTTTYTISNNNSNLFIGSEQNASQNANCNISVVNIYNRVLSAAEIIKNYTATKSRYGL